MEEDGRSVAGHCAERHDLGDQFDEVQDQWAQTIAFTDTTPLEP